MGNLNPIENLTSFRQLGPKYGQFDILIFIGTLFDYPCQKVDNYVQLEVWGSLVFVLAPFGCSGRVNNFMDQNIDANITVLIGRKKP